MQPRGADSRYSTLQEPVVPAQSEAGISFVVVTYNSAQTIVECLSSILAQTRKPVEAIVVDNDSQDSTAEIVASEFPNVILIRNLKNVGFGAAVNMAAQIARGDLLSTVNPDAFLDDRWSQIVVQFLESDIKCAAVEGKIMLADKPGFLNCAGSHVNILGFGCATKCGERDMCDGAEETVPYPSGAAFVVKRDVFLRVGGFDKSYFLYHDDVDLGLRIYAAGWHIHYVPGAVAHHYYKPNLTPSKIHYLELNRWRTLVKNMPLVYFLSSGPLLAISEIGITVKLASVRLLSAKSRAMLEFLKSLPQALEARKAIRRHALFPGVAMRLITDDFPAITFDPGFTASFSRRLISAYLRAFADPRNEPFCCRQIGKIAGRAAP